MTEAELFCSLAKASNPVTLANNWLQVQKDTTSTKLTKLTFGDKSVVYINSRGDVQSLSAMAYSQAEETLWPEIWKWLLKTPTTQWPVEFRDALAAGPSYDPIGAEVLATFLK